MQHGKMWFRGGHKGGLGGGGGGGGAKAPPPPACMLKKALQWLQLRYIEIWYIL
jgi:hypothetical protein